MFEAQTQWIQPAREASQYLAEKYDHTFKKIFLKNDSRLTQLLTQLNPSLEKIFTVFEPKEPRPPASSKYRALTWNIERGKNLPAILKALKEHDSLKEADFILLTEVDWGMARTGNKNIAQELGQELEMYTYFVPSFFNLTRGHGGEKSVKGTNELGLHGKAILSKRPLTALRSVALPNLTNLMRGGEARYGCKRALLADFQGTTLACVHLDCYSSPRSRARQIKPLLDSLSTQARALIAGDWNTNTHNTTNTAGLSLSMLKQLLTGPRKAVTQKYAHTHKYFDKPLFDLLSRYHFEIEKFNELGVSTFDLFINAKDLGAMAAERMPQSLIKMIDKLIGYCGGHIPLKLDWFAAKNLESQGAKVIKLPTSYHVDNRPPSDHHPIMLEFS